MGRWDRPWGVPLGSEQSWAVVKGGTFPGTRCGAWRGHRRQGCARASGICDVDGVVAVGDVGSDGEACMGCAHLGRPVSFVDMVVFAIASKECQLAGSALHARSGPI
jgi:hypothetical protein